MTILTFFDPWRPNRWPGVESDDLFQMGLPIGYRLFFRAPLAYLVHELQRLERNIVEIMKNRVNLTFDDLCWPDLWPEVKKDGSTFVIILNELSNAAYRMPLRGPRAELEGGVKRPPPQHSAGNIDHQHGAG